MISFIALIAGIIFGFRIIGSSMVNPALVLAFLDVTGDWDATLLWVGRCSDCWYYFLYWQESASNPILAYRCRYLAWLK